MKKLKLTRRLSLLEVILILFLMLMPIIHDMNNDPVRGYFARGEPVIYEKIINSEILTLTNQSYKVTIYKDNSFEINKIRERTKCQ